MRSLDDLPGPRGLPLVGNLLEIRPSRFHLIGERWCERYGPLFKFDLGRRHVIGVADLDLINGILRARPDGFRRASEVESVLDELGLNGLFSAEGEAWHRQRRLAVMALNANHLERYFSGIRRAAERLDARLASAASTGGPVAIQSQLKAFTIDVTSALAFGQDPGERDWTDVRDDIDRVFTMIGRRIGSPVPYWRYVALPADRALRRSIRRLRAVVAEFIEAGRQRMRDRPELSEEPENFLEGMLAAQALEHRYSEEELFASIFTMLVAGEDTTSATLGWATWYLARYPEVQRRLAREATELLGNTAVPADHETALAANYGDAVLRETLRLKPVAPMMVFEALEDTELGDVEVPARTRLAVFPRLAAARSGRFDDVQAFKPERWLDGSRGTGVGQQAFLAFGAGPRFCPGRNLALLEAKAALLTLAGNYEVGLDAGSKPVTEAFTFTMVPHDVNVVLRPRPRTSTRAMAPA